MRCDEMGVRLACGQSVSIDIEEYRLVGRTSADRALAVLHRLPAFVERTSGRSTADHRHDFDQIVHFREPAVHFVDYEEYVCPAGAIGFIPAGAVHRFCDETTGEGWVLNASAEAWADPANAAWARVLATGRSPFGKLNAAEVERYRSLALLLENVQDEHPSVAKATLSLALAIVTVALVNETAAPWSPVLVAFLGLVEETFAAPWSLPEYGKKLGVSPRSLHQMTTRHLARAPLVLVRERRLLEAKRLLGHSPLSVAEVAAQVGFDDPAYFSRTFRKQAGCSPSAFRTRQNPRR